MAADAAASGKEAKWTARVEFQGDVFAPLVIEDGGRLHQALSDVMGDAATSAGGTLGERQAFLTYWRQRLAVANLRGVHR